MTPEQFEIAALWVLGAVMAYGLVAHPTRRTYLFAALWPCFAALAIICAALGIQPPDDKG